MNNNDSNYTTNPLSIATHLATEPEFIRLPKSRERDPIFGLSRGYLNLLILPCKANQYRPPVKSCVLRKRGARTGVRLINLASLRDHILKHQEINSDESAA